MTVLRSARLPSCLPTWDDPQYRNNYLDIVNMHSRPCKPTRTSHWNSWIAAAPLLINLINPDEQALLHYWRCRVGWYISMKKVSRNYSILHAIRSVWPFPRSKTTTCCRPASFRINFKLLSCPHETAQFLQARSYSVWHNCWIEQNEDGRTIGDNIISSSLQPGLWKNIHILIPAGILSWTCAQPKF